MINQKAAGLVVWSACPPTTLLIPRPPLFSNSLNFHKLSALKISSAVEADSAHHQQQQQQLSARERRELRKERRASYNWKDEVEERLIKKPKKRYASWTEELNLDNLALEGPQWWVVRVSRVSGYYTAELMARSLARNFPSMDFKVFIPSVQIKKRLKNGTISVKPKSLFPGCVFLRCIMNKEVHDFIRECVGVGGFVGATVGNTKRQINKPRPVDDEDMEVIFRKVKEEQEIAEQAFLEENKGDGTLDPETSGFKDSQANSVGGDEHGSLLKPNGRARKAKTSATSKDIKVILRPGSPVRIVSGAFAGFSGVLKKAHLKKKMVTVAFTLFGKETIADLDVSEVVPDTS